MATMPEELHDHDGVLRRLRALMKERAARLIGVEGAMASGKTTLARRLALELGLHHVEADNFSFLLLHPDTPVEQVRGKSYLCALDLEALRIELGNALQSFQTVIIDGICLRDVLDRVQIKLDVAIYTKVISNNSPLWHVGIDLEEMDSEPPRRRTLDHEVLAYHAKTRPHERADLVFVWKEQ